MRRIVLAFVALLVLAVGGWVLRLLWLGGTFRSIEPHFAGRCTLVDGPVGAEDLTIDSRRGRAYLSATDRRAAMAGEPQPGAIWAYDLDQPDARPVNLTPDATPYFQPHGISLWRDPDGHAGHDVLFVVNHPAPGHGWPRHTVEVYDVGDSALIHRATLTDPRLVMPNDLVAVAADRFYVTNTHRHPPGALQMLETYLQLAGAEVLAYGPGGFSTAIPDLVFPNGINVSPDGRTVYVAAVTDRTVRVYDRNPATDVLTFRSAIPIATGGDNIEIDDQGTLWIGAHPKLLAVPRHQKDPSAPSPSQVLRVSPDGQQVDEIYLNDGQPISAASAAARRGNRLLIGQIFGRGFLDCEMVQEKGVTGDR
ncbi:MAG: SMP-30/gluconolactonase/LRE family protein [Deltaproteobacteria bacterium]|nr:SMP-30/gluconolactonase/LRE family protein [Deltaproteobacteria bacterium]